MNMEEYEDERGSKNIRDTSSCSKGSSYEVEEDEKRSTSCPIGKFNQQSLERSNPTNTPSPKARAHVFTILKCSIFF
jgi:hypothetical protein